MDYFKCGLLSVEICFGNVVGARFHGCASKCDTTRISAMNPGSGFGGLTRGSEQMVHKSPFLYVLVVIRTGLGKILTEPTVLTRGDGR